MFRIPARGRHITQEPQIISSGLLGRDLAGFRRRLVAFAVDAGLFGLVVGALFAGLTVWSFHREDPTLFSRTRAAFAADSTTTMTERDRDALLLEYYRMIQRRCPDAFPRDMGEFVRRGDLEGLHREFSGVSTTVSLGSGKTRTIENGDGTNQVIIGLDLVMGRFSGVLGWGGLFVAWFTFWTFVTRGRSPGKALVRVRVVRLDGGRLRLWDCFGRAGGYSASAATLFLGFLEAIWHPNRQAIHDKIAGTVVVRG